MAEFGDGWKKRFNANKFTSEDKKHIKQGKSLEKITKARQEALIATGYTLKEAKAIVAAEFGTDRVTTLVDGSDAKANAGFTVSFEHVPSETEVYFKSFLTAFNETYKPEWSSETVYGRADPIYMYKNTTRSISVGLVLPASTFGEGFENMSKLQQLIQFLYPTYTDSGNALTITQSPLIRLKVMNIITKQGTPGEDAKSSNAVQNNNMNQIINSNDASDGLLGVVQNLSINYNVENPDFGSFEVAKGTIIPKAIEINFDFSVVHEHHLGWDKESNFSNPEFPYNINTGEAQADAKKHMEQYAKGEAAKAALTMREAELAEKTLEEQQAQRDNWLARTLNATSRAFGSDSYAKRLKRDEREMKAASQAAIDASKAFNTLNDAAGGGAGADAFDSASDIDFIDS
jgi:hypothetical protein|tara:strand:- start:155 stop:1363 length:1209 start_codon:yes stop_codon:yes gene_type:complete